MFLFITPADLAPFADIPQDRAPAMIEDAEATAILAAPCLATLHETPAQETPPEQMARTAKINAVRAILRGAILRWHEAGSGAIQHQTAGPFGQTIDTRTPRRGMFWPTEIEQLRGVCSAQETGQAFAIDTVQTSTPHLPWCSLTFGALYCSCGTDLAGQPVFEAG